jgi:hypothetical protein
VAGKFEPPPIQGNKVANDAGEISEPYRKWLEKIPPALTSPATSGTVPKAANSQGVQGQMATDGAFLYICTGTNSWMKVPLSAL